MQSDSKVCTLTTVPQLFDPFKTELLTFCSGICCFILPAVVFRLYYSSGIKTENKENERRTSRERRKRFPKGFKIDFGNSLKRECTERKVWRYRSQQ